MGMKLLYKVSNRLTAEIEAKDINMAFRMLSSCDQILGVRKCGNCGGEHLQFKHTTPKGYEYYSIECTDCGHELKFGQAKADNRLFAKGWEAPFSGEGGGGQRDEPHTTSGEGEEEIPW
jgi:ribosomal protein S27E